MSQIGITDHECVGIQRRGVNEEGPRNSIHFGFTISALLLLIPSKTR